MMYSLLIADDDKWIRTGLREFIRWEEYGIEKIYEAKSGKEALQVIQINHVDILITDIRMPDLDGLELTKMLKMDYPNIKVIIISGYQYFEYAKKAMVYGACNYILKPIKEEEIIEQINRCIQIIQDEREEKEEKKNFKDRWNENVYLLRKQLIIDILNKGMSNSAQIQKKLQLCGLKLENENTVIFGIQIDKYLLDKKIIIDDKVQQKLNQILEEKISNWILSKGFIGMIAIIEDTTLYGFLNIKTKTSIKAIIEQFYAFCKIFHEGFNYSATIAFSEIVENFDQWSKAKEQVKLMLKRKFFEGKSKVLMYESQTNDTCRVKYIIDSDKEKAILNCFVCYENGGLKQILNDIHMDINQRKHILSSEDIKYVYSRMIDNLYFEVFKERLNSFDKIEQIETLDELQVYTCQNMEQWMEEYYKHKNKASQHVTREMLKYIEGNYHRKISLDSCANHLYMNSSYVSDLFSRQIGETFTHYLKKVRVKYAKEMLCGTNLRVYEVAQKVGYNDEKYFTKIFKELVGVTPKTYRDNS